MQKRFADLFIPHAGNDYRPDFLERVSVGIMLLLIVLTFSIANVQALLWTSSHHLVSSVLPSVIVERTNGEREGGELTLLKRNPLLDLAAEKKAEDMMTNGYSAHYSPTGVSPWHWFDAVGYNYLHAGENLAIHFTDSNEVVRAWMQSPLHQANIMDGKYTDIGVGTAEGVFDGYPTVVVVQLFGTQNAIPRREIATNVTRAGEGFERVSVEQVSDVSRSEDATATKEVAPATIQTVYATTVPSDTKMIEGKGSTESLALARESTPRSVSAEYKLVDIVEEIPRETVIRYADLATTSREGVPVILTTGGEQGESTYTSPQMLERTAVQPRLWLQVIYGVLALLVVLALMLSVVIEWRRQQPLQIVYACALLGIMGLLYHFHLALTSGVTIA